MDCVAFPFRMWRRKRILKLMAGLILALTMAVGDPVKAASVDTICGDSAQIAAPFPTTGSLLSTAANVEARLSATAGAGTSVDSLVSALEVERSTPQQPTMASRALYCAAAGEVMRLAAQGSQFQAQTYLSAAFRYATAAGSSPVSSLAAYRLGLVSLTSPGVAGARGSLRNARGGLMRAGIETGAAQTSGGGACGKLGSADLMTHTNGYVSATALECAIDESGRGEDGTLAALAGLRLAQLNLSLAESGGGSAAELRGIARGHELRALATAAGIASPAVRTELVGRLALLAFDLDGGNSPAVSQSIAAMLASAPNDLTARAYAAAIQARGALLRHDRRAALTLIRRAIFYESQRALPTRLAEWYLILAQADPDNRRQHLLAAYNTLENIRSLLPRNDPVTGESTFTLYLRPVFERVADALLDDDASGDEATRIGTVQRIVEAYRQAELQSAFGSECLPARDALKPSELLAGEVLLYPILLPDRVELIYAEGAAAGGAAVYHRLPPVLHANRQSVSRLVDTLVQSIGYGDDDSWRGPARQLYDLLIKPVEPHLQPGSTLVIIPDGMLRAVPFAALLDADGHYLIERTGLSLAPALAYSQPGEVRAKASFTIVAASLQREVTLPAGFFPKLNGTAAEAEAAARSGKAGRYIPDFRKADLISALASGDVDILHLATHASFNGRSDRAFIVANGEAIPLSELRRIIEQDRVRGDALELLVLSACETAVGDDEAGMGLAGAAVQAGVPSALASLWQVNDAGTAELMRQFYRRFRDGRVPRAGAARRAAQPGARRRREQGSRHLGCLHPLGRLAMRHGLRWPAGLALAGLASVFHLPVNAQDATRIRADTDAARSLGTTVVRSGTRYAIDGGRLAGSNLFHSFADFTLGAGDTAAWVRSSGNAGAIRNVISRVTGGGASTIAGTIDSTALPNANFFFVNPAGIMFGAGAQINVPAAAHFSTADEIGFSNGERFSVATPGGSTLSVAAPESFGFLGGAGPIAIDGARLSLTSPANSLTLTGGDIRLSDASVAAHASLNAVGAGKAKVALDGRTTAADPGASAGSITVSRSMIAASAQGGRGDVRLSGAAIVIDQASLIATSSDDDVPAPNISLDAPDVAVRESAVTSTTRSELGRSGSISIRARNLTVENQAGIATVAAPSCTAGGCVSDDSIGAFTEEVGRRLFFPEIEPSGGGRPGADPVGNGGTGGFGSGASRRAAGDVAIVASGSVRINDNSSVGSVAIDSANAGQVTIDSPDILLSNAGKLVVYTGDSDRQPQLRLTTGVLTLTDNSVVAALTYGSGNAGSVTVAASTIALSNQSAIYARAVPNSSGDAGSITLGTDQLTLDNGSTISSSTAGGGSAGSVSIVAKKVRVDRRSSIASQALSATGRAGNIRIAADAVGVASSSFISSSTRGAGGGGLVDLSVGLLSLTDNAIVASSTDGGGTAGNVVVTARGVLIDASRLTTSTVNAGNAGNINVTTDLLLVRNTGVIRSASLGAGVPGGARPGVFVSGSAGRVQVDAGEVTLDNGRISSSAEGFVAGASGSVLVNSPGRVSILNGGSVETSSSNPRTAGIVTIDAAGLTLDGVGSRIGSVNASPISGSAGTVEVRAGAITIADGATISTSSSAGSAGDIAITLPADGLLRLVGARTRGSITTSSGPGTGGRISIASPLGIISNGGDILALGERGGARVAIDTQFFIRSADRVNRVAVDGDFLLYGRIDDVSSGATNRDLSVIDASRVLRGQCPAVRASGEISQLIVRPTGPYASPPPSRDRFAADGSAWRGACL